MHGTNVRIILLQLHSVEYSPYEEIIQRAVSFLMGTWWRKVTIPVFDVFIEIFHLINPSGRNKPLGSTQPVTERKHQGYLLGYRWSVRRTNNINTYICQISENSGSHPPGDPTDCPGLYRNSCNLVKPLKSKMKIQGYSK